MAGQPQNNLMPPQGQQPQMDLNNMFTASKANRVGQAMGQYANNAYNNVSEKDARLFELLMAVPKMPLWKAAICALLNIGLAGFGTIVAACWGPKEYINKIQIYIGIFTWMTCFYVIGYLISFYWCYLFLKTAWMSDDNKQLRGMAQQAQNMDPNAVAAGAQMMANMGGQL